MTIPRLQEMADYWRSNPPLHFMVAAYFGIGSNKQEKAQDFDELQSMLGGSVSTELPEWLKKTE